ncbi:acetyltransferase [marine bacterium AO1-C]|nr:acetyltransferase [marine bacterium AO1-C]
MSKNKLLIFPLGGNGLEALDCLGDYWELIGYIDDDSQKQGRHPLGFNVFSRDALLQFPDAQLLAVQGGPDNFRKRKQVIEDFDVPMERFATVIHPSANLSKHVKIGYNCLLMAGVTLTFNAHIENHVCVLPNSVIHHDTHIGNYTLIGSNVVVAGHTSIGENCYIGSRSSIINNITIGESTLVGMGSNVIDHVRANAKVAGNPAKYL